MKRKLAKRIFASVLVFAMATGTFTQYVAPARNVQAETSSEPTYNAATDDLKYEKDTIDVAAGTNYSFGVTIPKEETYYMSFEVQSDTEIYFNFNGEDSLARMYLGQKQYGLFNLKEEKWPQGDFGLSSGVKITYSQGADGISVWLNGVKTQENLKFKTAADGVPKVSWVNGAASFKNVKIWTASSDTPAYDEAKHDLKYENDAIEVAAGKDYPFGVTIPKEETYYMSFEIQSDTEVYFDFSGKTSLARMYLGQTQYGLINFEEEKWPQGDFGLSVGAKIIYSQGPDGISIWVNGVKTLENLKPKTVADGAPRVQWVNGAASLKNVKIWTVLSDEPVYDEAKHDSKYENAAIDVAAGRDYPFGVTIPKEETYYMSFEIQSDTEVYFDFSGKTSLARMYLGQTQYGLINFEEELWPQGDFGLSSGAKITYAQGPEGISIWINGVKTQENLQPKTAADGVPRVQWVNGATSLKDVKIWTVKESEPIVSDEPTYDSDSQELLYEQDAVTIPANTDYPFGVLVSKDETYYMSFEVQSEADMYFDFCGKTSHARIYLGQTQYGLINFEEEKWPQGDFGLSSGAKITYSQGPDGISIWINGVKAQENLKPLAIEDGFPTVQWVSGDTTLKAVKMWTAKNTSKPPVSDVPVYDPEKHVLYEVQGSTGGTYQDGVLTVQPESSGYLNTDLDANADYYMSLIVKTKNPVNLSYRTKGQINLQSGGYESIGTGGAWVNKNFLKLSTGLPVTIHSTPDWITIWVDGEKILDEAYTNQVKGECRPGIAWSFNGEVSVSDVKIWTEQTSEREDMGEISYTQKSPLFVVKEYGVALRAEAQKKAYVDESPVGVSAQKSVVKGTDGQSEVIASDIKTQSAARRNLVKASIPIAGVLVMLAVVIVQIVKRKKEQ